LEQIRLPPPSQVTSCPWGTPGHWLLCAERGCAYQCVEHLERVPVLVIGELPQQVSLFLVLTLQSLRQDRPQHQPHQDQVPRLPSNAEASLEGRGQVWPLPLQR
jgi:hypothetical protein